MMFAWCVQCPGVLVIMSFYRCFQVFLPELVMLIEGVVRLLASVAWNAAQLHKPRRSVEGNLGSFACPRSHSVPIAIACERRNEETWLEPVELFCGGGRRSLPDIMWSRLVPASAPPN